LEQELLKAEKFIWIQTDQVFKNLIPIVAEKIKQPFDFRFISPQDVMPPDDTAPLPSTMPNVKKKMLPKVDIVVVVTDKTAGFCLPQLNGRLDYRNFHGTDPKFRKWCQDLFLHYWKKAKPVIPIEC
jgi:predicted transcriptional regulator